MGVKKKVQRIQGFRFLNLDGAVVRRGGDVVVIGGETAVVDRLKVAEQGVLRCWFVEVPQLRRNREN